jgi:hypothetical protein
MLARRCMDDAEIAGFTNHQIEEDLGTDLIDFMTSELKFRSERLAQVPFAFVTAAESDRVRRSADYS